MALAGQSAPMQIQPRRIGTEGLRPQSRRARLWCAGPGKECRARRLDCGVAAKSILFAESGFREVDHL